MNAWAAGGDTHRGKVRASNQDVLVNEPDLGLYVVLDGMGGANAGEVAARLAGEAIAAFVRKKSRTRRRAPDLVLELALQQAAATVFHAAAAREECRGMGTTVVACLVVDSTRAVIAHAGDSRAYLWRAGELTALTRDHTVAQTLLDEGVSPSEIGREHQRQLTRNLGRWSKVQAELREQALQPGDRLLLCSDGLYGGMPPGAIQRVMGSKDTPDRVAHQLVSLALRGKASDNISALVIAVDGRPPLR